MPNSLITRVLRRILPLCLILAALRPTALIPGLFLGGRCAAAHEELTGAQFLAEFKTRVAARDSGAFVRLDDSDVECCFKALIEALLAEDLHAAGVEIDALDACGVRYRTLALADTPADDPIFGFMETAFPGDPDYRGWGAALVRPRARTRIVYQAPHVRADLYTEDIALHALLRDAGAWMALFAGTHRYANGDADGDGDEDSDAAHDTENLFHALTAYLARRGEARGGTPWVVQYHGAADRDTEPDVVASGGAPAPGCPLVSIDDAVDAAGNIRSGVCGWSEEKEGEDGDYLLCVSSNVQYALMRGMGIGDGFLHLEIERAARADYHAGSGPGHDGVLDLLDAVAEILGGASPPAPRPLSVRISFHPPSVPTPPDHLNDEGLDYGCREEPFHLYGWR